MSYTRLLCFWGLMNILLITSVSYAQTASEELLEELLLDISSRSGEEESPDWQNELEELSQRLEEPVDLNTATRRQLEQFPFLTDIQIEHLLAYIYVHGEMHSLYELQLVEEMDRETISYLLPFVCLLHKEKRYSPLLLKDMLKYSRHEFLTRVDIPLYIREGYRKNYVGPPVYNSVKYAVHYRDRFYAGVVAEKDAGEPFGALYNKQGYDFYSFYFLLRNTGRLKTLALGNYRLSFGQGLVISMDYLLGKTSFFTTSRAGGIKKHSSTDEYNYLRGAAVDISLARHWSLAGFYSHRTLDGAVKKGEITSIYKTGLHRSLKESEKIRLFTQQLTGYHLTYQQSVIKLGITGIYYFFNRSYEPSLTGYTKYDLHGVSFYNVGMDYAYRFRRWTIEGEVAKGRQGMAFLNRLHYSPAQDYRFLVLYRYYSYDYWAMYARSFEEGGSVQNENGWYVAAEMSPFARWKFFLSLDICSFPWWNYRVSKPSQAREAVMQADFLPRGHLNVFVRYRYKQRERDVAGTQGKSILDIFHHQLRCRLNYSFSQLFSSRTTLDYNHFHSQQSTAKQGYQMTQAISCKLPRIPVKIEFQGSYFYTGNYDTRVYMYEKGLLYTFSTSSLQGKGTRLVASVRYDIGKHWMLLSKFGETVYWDRNRIGTGNDMIYGNKKADIQLQLRMKF